MKKHSVFFLAFVFSGFCFGQLEWVNGYISWQSDYAHNFFTTKNGQYVLFHGNDHTVNKMTVFSSEGNKVYHFHAPGGPGNYNVEEFKDLIHLPDSSVAVLTFNIAVDTASGWGNAYGTVLKFDKEWNVVQISDAHDYDNTVAVTSSGNYILLNSTSATKVAAGGSWVWSEPLWDYNCQDLIVTPADTIFIATEIGLIKMDTAGSIIGEYPEHVFDDLEINDNGNFVGVKNDSITILSPNLEPISTYSFSGDNIIDYDFFGDSIAILTESRNVYLFNESFNQFHNFQIIDDGSFDFINMAPEQFVLSGTEWYGSENPNHSVRSSFFKEYSFEGDNYDLSNDVGISNVSQAEETVVLYQGPSSYQVVFKNIKVSVKNFGNNPIEDFHLWTPYKSAKNLEGLFFLPEEEIVVTWNEIKRNFSGDPAGQMVNLCFWTSHPDNLMDLDASNDYMCSDFLVNNEEVFSENNITIFPNPASDYINIKSSDHKVQNNFTLSIFNSIGNIIMEIPYSEKIEVADFSPGIYLLKIVNEKGELLHVEKLVVQK